VVLRSVEKLLGMGSKLPRVTFAANACMLVALNGGNRVIIS